MRTDRPRSSKAGRPPEVLDRIERSRDRIKARRDAARLREQVILAAVKRYIEAWQAITAHENRRDSDIEQLRRRITEVEAEASTEIDRHRVAQASAAATLREQGQSDDDIAELLEITSKEVRRLLGLARTAAEPTTTQPDSTTGGRSRMQKQSSATANTPDPGSAHPIGSKEPDPPGKPDDDEGHIVARDR